MEALLIALLALSILLATPWAYHEWREYRRFQREREKLREWLQKGC